MKGVSRAGYLPAKLKTKVVNRPVSKVGGCSKMIGVLSEHSHAVISERGEHAAADKMRLDRHEIVVENVDPMFYLKRRSLFP